LFGGGEVAPLVGCGRRAFVVEDTYDEESAL